ncbi:MAG: site-2 protease family protein [Candidatus Bruticola sp.]
MAVIQWIIHNLPSLIAVCVAFGFIITIHELGHFIMARRVGIRCPRFCLGFGPRLFSFNYRGTEFSICLLPLGGYVMMLGEDPENDEEQTEFKMVSQYLTEDALPGTPSELADSLEKMISEDPQKVPEEEKAAFYSVVGHIRYLPKRVYTTIRELEGNFNDKSVWARMAVVLGGVTMNFISALIMFWIIGACYGMAELSPSSLPIVMKVFDNSPAAVAGLKYGDKIESINHHPVVSGVDMVRLIGKYPVQSVPMEVTRGQEKLTMTIVPNLTMAGVNFKAVKGGGVEVISINPFGNDDPTAQFKEGDIVTAVNGRNIADLSSMQSILRQISSQKDKNSKGNLNKIKAEFSLKDGRTLAMEMFAEEFAPVGKIGIMPAQVTEFKFNNTTTNQIKSVAEGSLAAQNGFKEGDYLFLINGARVTNQESCSEILSKLAQGSEPLAFDIMRGSEHVRLQLNGKVSDPSQLGITFQPITFATTFKHSFVLIGRLIIAPVIIVKQMVDKVLSPELVKSSMSGPLGIMQMIFELSNEGLGKFLYIVALINAAVGAFNVIPFPALDGARFVVLLIGGLRGKEVDPAKEAWVHQIGLYLLLGFVILVTYIDIMRLWAGVPLTN